MADATVLGMVYGLPKRMKTSMVLSAFPNALWIPGEGVNAVKSVARNEWGFDPLIYDQEVRTLMDLIDVLDMLEAQDLVSEYGAVCVDGMTALCETSLRVWQDNPRITEKGKEDKFWPYQQLKDKLLRLTERARHIGVSVFMVAHEQSPSQTFGGEFVPGGPSLGSKGQVVRVPAWCDFNARAVVNKDYPDPWMNGALFVDHWDTSWVTGDRNGVAYAESPPNVRELLRASAVDYGLTRLPGLEWQDDVADVVAGALVADGVDAAIQAGVAAAQKHAKGSGRDTQLHIRWAVQDGIARGVIQARRSRNMFQNLEMPSTKKSTTPPPPPSE